MWLYYPLMLSTRESRDWNWLLINMTFIHKSVVDDLLNICFYTNIIVILKYLKSPSIWLLRDSSLTLSGIVANNNA